MEKTRARKLVVEAGRELVREGLIARTWGNVSCRVDYETFMITPSGRDYMTLTPEEIVEVNIGDLSYKGDIKPSSEKRIHREVYIIRPDVNFIIHTHQEQASVVASMNINNFPVPWEYVELLGEEVLCAAYGLPGTKSLCKNTAKAVEKSKGKAVILKNHGAICMGRSYEETFRVSQNLELVCENFIKKCGGELDEKDIRIPDKEAYTALMKIMPKGFVYVLNQEPAVVKYSSKAKSLYPYIDDFAQMVGTKAEVIKAFDGPGFVKAFNKASGVLIESGGAICRGRTKGDAEASSMLMTKNCKSYFGAMAEGNGKAIKPIETLLMRNMYLRKYSKMDGKNR